MKKYFLDRLNTIDKDYFTFADLLKLWDGSANSLKVALSRAVKNGELKKLKTNIYILNNKNVSIEKIANKIYYPSYLSFESALSSCGILSQIPYVLTFATPSKTKKITLGDSKVEYRQIRKDLFFGFILKDGLYVALPEKALLDSFYLASLGKLELNFRRLDYGKINKKRFHLWLKRYPERTRKTIENTKLKKDKSND
jgi:predicted transcriptional regulator of viral defense system